VNGCLKLKCFLSTANILKLNIDIQTPFYNFAPRLADKIVARDTPRGGGGARIPKFFLVF
jgi:hypothetical protein